MDIFLVIAPPAILQPGNGHEFIGNAYKKPELAEEDVVDVSVLFDLLMLLLMHDIICSLFPFVDDQICRNVADFWPRCKMVTGSARHNPSNGGIERFNRTTQARVTIVRVCFYIGCPPFRFICFLFESSKHM